MSSSSPKFTPTTTDTTSTVTQGPTYTSGTSATTTQNKIPSWLESTSQSMVQRAQNLSQTPYVPYGGQRIAEFAPMMEEAFGRIGSQGVAGQVGAATGLAQQAGLAGLSAGQFAPYQTGQFTGETAQQYMSPYMQSVLDTQMREAQRQADIATTTRAGAATRAGAFGGSRQAIMDAEAQRNLALQKGDIQAAGMQQAFTAAQQQFNTEQALAEQARRYGAELGIQGGGQALQAAQALGQLGQTQFGQEMDITQGLGYAGALQQQQRQAELDVAYQDFLARQKYPYEQIAFLQGITAGAPHSTTQISDTRTSGVTTPGAQTTMGSATQYEAGKKPGSNITSNAVNVSQATGNTYSMLAQGGIVGYAEGGITGLLSDQQLRKRQQDNTGTVSALAKFIVDQEQADRRAVRQAAMAQAAQMQGQRPTVAEEAMAGLDTLPVPERLIDDTDGGVMALAGGGAVQRYQGGGLSGLFGMFSTTEDDLPELMAARERYRAAGADTSGIDQAINAITAKPAENRGILNAADATLRSETAPNQSVAESARLLRASEGLPAIAKPDVVAPPAPAPKPDLRDRQGVNRTDTTQTDRALGATPEARAMGAQGAAQAGATAVPVAGGLDDLRRQEEAALQDVAKLKQADYDFEATAAADAIKDFDRRVQEQMESDAPARESISKREKDLDEKQDNAVWVNVMRGALVALMGKGTRRDLARAAAAGFEGWVSDVSGIDEKREKLRADLDRLNAARAQLKAASGKDRAALLAEERKALQVAKTGVAGMLADANYKAASDRVTQATNALAKEQERARSLRDQMFLTEHRENVKARLRPQGDGAPKETPLERRQLDLLLKDAERYERLANDLIKDTKVIPGKPNPNQDQIDAYLKAAADARSLYRQRVKLPPEPAAGGTGGAGGAQPVVDLGKWQR